MIDKILNSYINNERGVNFSQYNLDGITSLLEVLGNPHRAFKTVHVAGTNGKGSTCFMIARVLEKSGYRTGLFISPHLVAINERISVNSHDITDDDLYTYIKRIDETVLSRNIPVTYFDLLTAAAFCYFRDSGVDIAVIETGLGGRLDSTNVITPEVSVITDISMDHAHILGDSIEAITAEKCGIIKKGVPVVTTNDDPAILRLIKETSDSFKSRLFSYGISFHAEKYQSQHGFLRFGYRFNDADETLMEIPLFPEHQIKNAAASATALLLLKESGFDSITSEVITSTLKQIIIPGRFQKLSISPAVIYDPAHNIASLTNLLSGCDMLYPGKRVIIILTMMKDKVTDEVLSLLNARTDRIIYYIMDDPRAYIPEKNRFSLITDNKNLIIEHIKSEIDNNSVILFTGTFRIFNLSMDVVELIS